jgi:hypothetical protein
VKPLILILIDVGSLMLDLLNEYAMYVNITWGREAAVKVHCSTGQVMSHHNHMSHCHHCMEVHFFE